MQLQPYTNLLGGRKSYWNQWDSWHRNISELTPVRLSYLKTITVSTTALSSQIWNEALLTKRARSSFITYWGCRWLICRTNCLRSRSCKLKKVSILIIPILGENLWCSSYNASLESHSGLKIRSRVHRRQ